MDSSQTDKRLTSERFAEFAEALEILYISGNLSGRVQFAQSWPQAALYVFGAELVHYDREGVSDRARRAVLEEEAEDRRLELLEIVATLEEKSVDKGVLQVEYVDGLVRGLGRELALLMYAPHIVDRFIPAPDVPVEEKIAPVPVAVVAPVEEEIITVPEDPMDRIKPISVEPEAGMHAPRKSGLNIFRIADKE